MKSWLQRTGAAALLVTMTLSAGCHRPVETPMEARRFCIGLLLDYVIGLLSRTVCPYAELERVKR